MHYGEIRDTGVGLSAVPWYTASNRIKVTNSRMSESAAVLSAESQKKGKQSLHEHANQPVRRLPFKNRVFASMLSHFSN